MVLYYDLLGLQEGGVSKSSKSNVNTDVINMTLRWTDTGSRIMAAILFLITYQNIQKWFKMY